MIDRSSGSFQYYEQIRLWVEEEFDVLTSFGEESELLHIIFSHSDEKMAIMFKPYVQNTAYITATLNFSESMMTLLQQSDTYIRDKIQKDLIYEISGYNVPFSTQNKGNLIVGIQFVQPYYDSNISKNSFISMVNKVYNAKFRGGLYIDKTY